MCRLSESSRCMPFRRALLLRKADRMKQKWGNRYVREDARKKSFSLLPNSPQRGEKGSLKEKKTKKGLARRWTGKLWCWGFVGTHGNIILLNSVECLNEVIIWMIARDQQWNRKQLFKSGCLRAFFFLLLFLVIIWELTKLSSHIDSSWGTESAYGV